MPRSGRLGTSDTDRSGSSHAAQEARSPARDDPEGFVQGLPGPTRDGSSDRRGPAAPRRPRGSRGGDRSEVDPRSVRASSGAHEPHRARRLHHSTESRRRHVHPGPSGRSELLRSGQPLLHPRERRASRARRHAGRSHGLGTPPAGIAPPEAQDRPLQQGGTGSRREPRPELGPERCASVPRTALRPGGGRGGRRGDRPDHPRRLQLLLVHLEHGEREAGETGVAAHRSGSGIIGP